MTKCEACEKHAQVKEGLCSACILEGYRKVLEDDCEGLERYLGLKERELTAPEKTFELEMAKGYGWL